MQAPLVGSSALLALGTIIVFPFEINTIVTMSDNRLVAMHYGLYNWPPSVCIVATSA